MREKAWPELSHWFNASGPFLVGVEGIPLEAFAFSSTNKAFETPTVDAVMKWRFKPATIDG